MGKKCDILALRARTPRTLRTLRTAELLILEFVQESLRDGRGKMYILELLGKSSHGF